MPIYEYRCKKGHNFEVMKGFSDGPVTRCEVCEAPVQRVFHPIAVHFKGSGFYNTDYGTRKRSREMKEHGEGVSSSSESSKDGTAATKSDSSANGAKADSATTKTETKTSKASKASSGGD